MHLTFSKTVGVIRNIIFGRASTEFFLLKQNSIDGLQFGHQLGILIFHLEVYTQIFEMRLEDVIVGRYVSRSLRLEACVEDLWKQTNSFNNYLKKLIHSQGNTEKEKLCVSNTYDKMLKPMGALRQKTNLLRTTSFNDSQYHNLITEIEAIVKSLLLFQLDERKLGYQETFIRLSDDPTEYVFSWEVGTMKRNFLTKKRIVATNEILVNITEPFEDFSDSKLLYKIV